jgi:hypothetical protein
MGLYLAAPSSKLTQTNQSFRVINAILKLIFIIKSKVNSDRNTYLDFELFFSKNLSVLIQIQISDN